MSDLCVVGAGVTGLGLLLLLQEAGADLSKVTIVDPQFDGGDLARRWTSVVSNTPWSKSLNALKEVAPSTPLEPVPDPEQCSTLSSLSHTILRAARSPLRRATQVQGLATQAAWDSATQLWSVKVDAAGKVITVKSKALILCPGAEPKQMNLPVASIPLEIALDAERLKQYVRAGEKVVVYGTMHSGTLVIRNLTAAGARVTAHYASPEPFYWDRDGVYDGIKREAADVADEIVAGRIPVDLVPVSDTSGVIRAALNADWTVYAMGFRPRLVRLLVDGAEASAAPYDGATGALKAAPKAWGFGVAYPNQAPDDIHWDVSVAAFLTHMKSQLPAILQTLL